MWDLTVTYGSGRSRQYQLATRERARNLKRALRANATAAGVPVSFHSERA